MSTLHVENLKGLSSGGNANKIIVPSGQTIDASAGTLVPSASQMVQNVVGSKWTTQTVNNSTSYVDLTSLAITPKYSNSLIKVCFSYMAGGGHALRLYRDSTVIFQPTNTYMIYDGYEYTNQQGWNNNSHRRIQYMSFVDTPSSTSSVTYKWQAAAYLAANSSGVGFNELTTSGGAYSYMEILEIKQ